MELRSVRYSDTVTRYYVSALLGTNSVLMLVQPESGTIVATWRSDSAECLLHGEWISPYADLEAFVDGIDLAPTPEPSSLRLVDAGVATREEPASAHIAVPVGRSA